MEAGVKDKKIAVIGVSPREEKFGFRIFRDLLQNGFQVEGVHPLAPEVLGRKTYKNLSALPHPPDLVITVVPGQVTEKVVEECKSLGIKEIWMQPGSESQAAIKQAENYGMAVTHDACFMVEQGLW